MEIKDSEEQKLKLAKPHAEPKHPGEKDPSEHFDGGPVDWKADLKKILMAKRTLFIFLFLVGIVVGKVGITTILAGRHKFVAPSVNVVIPVIQDMDSSTSLPANMEAIEQASLYAHVSGYLKKIYVDEGDKVKKDQLLAVIDAPDIVEDYNRVKAELNLKDVTLTRYKELLADNVISQQEFDVVNAAYSEAKARYDSAAAMMEYTQIKAPFTGSIARRFKYPGDLITVSTSKEEQSPIFLLVNESTLRIVVNVPQVEVAHIKIGDPVEIKIDTFPDQGFKGTISRIDALFDEETKTQRVLIDIENPDGKLRAGMFASVILHFEHIDKALTIPSKVVQATGKQAFVFVVRNNKAVRLPVTLGLHEGELVQVIDGLKPDDQVIDPGMLVLEDGNPVNPVADNSTGTSTSPDKDSVAGAGSTAVKDSPAGTNSLAAKDSATGTDSLTVKDSAIEPNSSQARDSALATDSSPPKDSAAETNSSTGN